jgi:hypothetical protein
LTQPAPGLIQTRDQRLVSESIFHLVSLFHISLRKIPIYKFNNYNILFGVQIKRLPNDERDLKGI